MDESDKRIGQPIKDQKGEQMDPFIINPPL